METQLLKPDINSLEKAAELLKKGEVVAVPTETVYGLAANALDVEAVRKIFTAKGRPQDNPLILHISDTEMLYDIVKSVPALAEKLSEAFWPGPLTMIFPRKPHIPKETCGGLDTVAVRMPNHEFTRRLIALCGFPLAAPSANTSGLPSPTKAVHVFRDMNGKIPMIIDGGACDFGIESTVITFENNVIRLLRPGAVTAEMLREYADVIVDNGVLEQISPEQRVISPGMKYKHYSPKAEVYILDAGAEEISAFLMKESLSDKKISVLCCSFVDVPDNCIRIEYGDTSEEQAEKLFSGLRAADDMGCSVVYVQKPSLEGIGLAVYNRLLRSAAFRVIKATPHN